MNWHTLSHLPYEKIQDVQNKAFRSFVRHQMRYSPWYREQLKKHDLSPSDFQTTDDLVKLPFTTKEDLAPREDDRGRPRQFILQPDETLLKAFAPKSMLARMLVQKMAKRDVRAKLNWEYKPIHLHFTTGRTALPTPFVYTARDLLQLQEAGRRLLDVTGVSPAETGINAFPYSPHLAFWQTHYAMTSIGMTGLSTGGGKVMGTLKIIDAIEKMHAGILAIIPGYCYHLLREAVAQKRDFSALRYIMLGGERVSDGFRRKALEYLHALGAENVTLLATYALTEAKTAWTQCSERSGYHLYPDFEFIELIDDEGRRVTDGPGEIVLTLLDWRGSCVVRYRTGDLAPGIDTSPCPTCGKTVPRILPDIQRKSEVREFHLTKVKGELVNLNVFFPLLSGMKEIDEWQVIIRKKNDDPFEVDEILVTLCLRDGQPLAPHREQFTRMIRSEIGVGVTLEEKPLPDILQSLGMDTELKEKRILDLRPRT